MDLESWAKEIAEAFKVACGERGRIEQLYALPKEFNKFDAENSVLLAIHECMPSAAIEVWVDSYSRLNIRKHLT